MGLEIILFCLLGAVTGFFAGMLGIGGGIFVVPGLTIIFSYMGFEQSLVIKYAIATSLSIMIFTSISAVRAHYKRSNINFDILKNSIIPIILGTVIGSAISHFINAKYLKIIFGIFLFFVAIKMLIGFKVKKHKKVLTKKILYFVCSLIGLKSGILGVGGGAISVPFLSYFGVPMKKAAGISSCFTFTIAIIGTISFVIFGEHVKINEKYFWGYIYIPALICVAFFAFIFAGIGAKATHLIPNKVLQIIFGIILIFLCFQMFFYDFFFS